MDHRIHTGTAQRASQVRRLLRLGYVGHRTLSDVMSLRLHSIAIWLYVQELLGLGIAAPAVVQELHVLGMNFHPGMELALLVEPVV